MSPVFLAMPMRLFIANAFVAQMGKNHFVHARSSLEEINRAFRKRGNFSGSSGDGRLSFPFQSSGRRNCRYPEERET